MDNGAACYRRYLNGDMSGLEELVGMYANSLIFFINGYVHSLSVAEDLAEDTFLELIIHKKRFRENASFKTYLFKIGRNKALNYLKKESRMRPLGEYYRSDVSAEAADFAGFEEFAVESGILRDERSKALNAAMQDLNREYREILHLLYFEDMTYDEAAAVMKKSRKQVDNLAYRAKQKLKAALEKDGFVYEG